VTDAASGPEWSGELRPLLRWAAEAPPNSWVELVCGHNDAAGRGPREPLVVRLPGCLAEVSDVSYVELVAAGLAKVTARTDGCPNADAVRSAVTAAGEALALTTIARSHVVECVDARFDAHRRTVHELGQLPMSRRRLLLIGAPPRAAGSERTTSGQQRLVDALRLLGATAALPAGPATPAAGRGADLSATACTGCGVCVRVCPDDAVRLESGGAGRELRLLHFPARCSDCGDCVRQCPTGALTRRGSATWQQLLGERPRLLATMRVRECVRCHAPIASAIDGDHCPTCSFRVAHPFGSALAGR
jgi:ferredoxin